MSEDAEMEDIRRRKMLELQRRLTQEQQSSQLRKILTPKARQRLTNLKMVKRDFANQLELQLIQLAQQKRVDIPISDETLKQILVQLQSHRRDIKITRR
jgi:programmed cell death protein 5